MTGCPVDLVLYDEGQTRLIKTVIATPLPLRLKVLDDSRDGVRSARRVMLLAHHEGLSLRADGHLNRVVNEDLDVFLEINQVHWELLERRRHIRVPVNVEVNLRAVLEGGAEPTVDIITGTTLDLSISGAFVRATTLPQEGSLVEFSAELDGETVRILAVVAHITRERSGVGLHFVEYIDNARYMIHEFLTNAA